MLPGFRKGRVPVNLVIQNVGADFIRGEALEDAIPEWGDEALKEAGLYDDAVGTSDLQVGPLDESQDYAFTLKVQTMPVPTLGEYKGLEVPKREVEITDDQVSAQLAMLQERLASLQPVEDRAVQTGDFVLMDLAGSRDGEPIEGAQGKDQMYEVGRGNLIPGFEEELVGVKAGEEKSFDIIFPEDYHAEELAGQPATFTVTVKEIKEKIVPELDDAFAADVSEFETMDELRDDVRERLQAAAERRRAARVPRRRRREGRRARDARGPVHHGRPRGAPALPPARGARGRAGPHHGGLPRRAREDRGGHRRGDAAAGRVHHQAAAGARGDRARPRPSRSPTTTSPRWSSTTPRRSAATTCSSSPIWRSRAGVRRCATKC